MSDIVILDAETYNPETSGKNPVGTGPYVVKDYVVNNCPGSPGRLLAALRHRNVVFKNIRIGPECQRHRDGQSGLLASCPPQDADYVDS